MNIICTFKGMDTSVALREYFEEKINQHLPLLEKCEKLEVLFKESVSNKGVDSDFEIDINAHFPHDLIHLTEVSNDMYANVDKSLSTLLKLVKKYTQTHKSN